MRFPDFLRENSSWLAAGAVMTLSTGFGQTFFISIYAPHFRAAFDLSHGQWGAIYMTATLASAVALTQAGRLADIMRARTLALAVIALFALVAVGIASVGSALMLGVLVFGLRFCGQGMLSHVALVAMGKWFRAGRARAVAVAHLGFSAAEATLPAGALLLIPLIGWRESWLIVAAALVLVSAPLILWLLRAERSPRQAAEAQGGPGLMGRHWTRVEMLRHWLFWALLPGVAAPSWVGTVIFFQIAPLTAEKGWDMLSYAALAYPAYSVATIAASFAFGVLADRRGATTLMPVFPLLWAAACLALGVAGGLGAGVAALAVAGVASGCVGIVAGALFAELYGARHLGGVKALFVAVSVLASAVGPGVSGLLLDLGVGFGDQLFGMAAYLVAAAAGFEILRRRLVAMAAAAY